MAKVTFDYSAAKSFISDAELDMMKKIAEDAKQTLVSRTGVETYLKGVWQTGESGGSNAFRN